MASGTQLQVGKALTFLFPCIVYTTRERLPMRSLGEASPGSHELHRLLVVLAVAGISGSPGLEV